VDNGQVGAVRSVGQQCSAVLAELIGGSLGAGGDAAHAEEPVDEVGVFAQDGEYAGCRQYLCLGEVLVQRLVVSDADDRRGNVGVAGRVHGGHPRVE